MEERVRQDLAAANEQPRAAFARLQTREAFLLGYRLLTRLPLFIFLFFFFFGRGCEFLKKGSMTMDLGV
jgi:hypothetical protein